MASTFYPKGAEKILGSLIDFSGDTIKMAVVSDAYTYSAAHEFLTDLGTVLGTPATLASKTITGGAFDAADTSTGVLAAGSVAKAAALFKDTGNAATSPLLAYIDGLTGFPFTTTGSSGTVIWPSGTARIFSLMPA